MSVTIDPKSFWEAIGRTDKARDSFLIRADEESYWQSGEGDADFIFREAKKHGKNNFHTILEYGSGDGRIARFMSAKCDEFICTDIAESVLNLARQQLTERFGLSNIRYAVIESLEAQESFADLIYSMQVVQHNPPQEQKRIMSNIYRFLKPGGLACIALSSLKDNPGYENGPTCMCFTYEQVEDLARVFDSYKIAHRAGEYLVWGMKD